MNLKTEYYTMKGIISEMSPEDREAVNQKYEALKSIVCEGDEKEEGAGIIALALLSMELIGE